MYGTNGVTRSYILYIVRHVVLPPFLTCREWDRTGLPQIPLDFFKRQLVRSEIRLSITSIIPGFRSRLLFLLVPGFLWPVRSRSLQVKKGGTHTHVVS